MEELPGLDRASLLAAFSGAIAYLCTQEKMPVVRATAYVVAGTVAAAYIGPGVVEWIDSVRVVKLGERTRFALIFVTGVGGIWLLNLIVAILKAASDRAGDFVGKLIERIFGPKGGA